MNNIPHIDKEIRKNMEALKEVAERHPDAIKALMTSGGNMKVAMLKHPKIMMALAKDLQTTAKEKGVDLKELMSQGESFAKSQGMHIDVPKGGIVMDESTAFIEEEKTKTGFFSKFKKNN